MIATGLKIALAIVLVALVAVGASAALDAPSRSSATVTVIDAPRERVWRIVIDFDSYREWNSYMPSVQGRAAAGRTLDIHLAPPGAGAQDVEASVTVFKPPRKLRWQSPLLAPGLRDLEYEVIVAPLGPGRTEVTQRARYEGLLVTFMDSEPTDLGLERMAAALKRRAESGA